MSWRAGAAAAILAMSAPARAHGFGQRYDLPLPLEIYLFGAALVVAISCVMFARYVRVGPGAEAVARVEWTPARARLALGSSVLIAALRLLAVAFYFLLIFAGFFGHQNPFRNLVPVSVWAVWWVGMGYVSALVGDVWKIANPLETLFAFAERLHARWRGRRLSLDVAPPAFLQAWPAVALYLVFLWMEVAWEGSDSPRAVAMAMVAYSLLTWTGMYVFGREAWLERGEVFHRVFGLFARFSPMRITLRDRRPSEWELRPYAVGLLAREPANASEIALVILVLAAVSFDGFLETPAWAAIVEAAGEDAGHAARIAGLVLVPLLFFAIYAVFCRLIVVSAGVADVRATTRRIAGLFVLTLVPIAIAYQVAHYLSFLVQAGQYLVPLASDPFGWGWDLFGTRNHFVRIGIVEARVVWITSVVAIVAGHVAALYLGHVLSIREFPGRRAAIRSEGPMLVLMVAYTMLSLWIIAQPIVTTR